MILHLPTSGAVLLGYKQWNPVFVLVFGLVKRWVGHAMPAELDVWTVVAPVCENQGDGLLSVLPLHFCQRFNQRTVRDGEGFARGCHLRNGLCQGRNCGRVCVNCLRFLHGSLRQLAKRMFHSACDLVACILRRSFSDHCHIRQKVSVNSRILLCFFYVVGGLAKPFFGFIPRLLLNRQCIELDGGSCVRSLCVHVLGEFEHHVRLADGLP